jgi:hypothetical protein
MRAATLVVLAGMAIGCRALVFRPAAPRPPADIAPVELRRTDIWAVVVVANRDLTARRFAWIDSSVPPCKGGIAPATIDRADAGQRGDVRLSPGQRLEVGFPKGDAPWPFPEGPTGLDVEEVRPEGTSCHRIPLTGAAPTEQWQLDRRWAALVGLGAGWSTTPTSSGRPIDLGWFYDLTTGLGRGIGPLRLDASVAFGGIGCTGCPDGDNLIRTAAGVGVTGAIWQGRAHALQIGAAYRRTFAFTRFGDFSFNGGRLAIAWGRTPPPIVGLQWNNARTGIFGFEAFAEWLAPLDDRIGPQLVLGAGVVMNGLVF